MLCHPKAVSKHLHELQGNPRSTKPVNKVECDTKNNTTTKAQQELKKKTNTKNIFMHFLIISCLPGPLLLKYTLS